MAAHGPPEAVRASVRPATAAGNGGPLTSGAHHIAEGVSLCQAVDVGRDIRGAGRAGAVHTNLLWHTVLLAPAAAIRVLFARLLSSRLDMRRTRGVAVVLAVASATVLVIQQFV